jgi:hypothetical protein
MEFFSVQAWGEAHTPFLYLSPLGISQGLAGSSENSQVDHCFSHQLKKIKTTLGSCTCLVAVTTFILWLLVTVPRDHCDSDGVSGTRFEEGHELPSHVKLAVT